MWTAFDASLLRTTNSCENFHSKCNNESMSPHPNIHAFLPSSINMQTDTYLKMNISKEEKLGLEQK